MATAKSNGTKHATRTLAEQKAADSEGWSDHSRWDFDGFWKVEVGTVLVGEVVEVRAIHDSRGKAKLIYIVKLASPCTIMKDGETAEAAADDVIACGESFGLQPLRDVVGALERPMIRLTAIEKKPLSEGRTLWTFKVQSKGGTPRKRPLNFDAILKASRYAKGEPERESGESHSDVNDDNLPF